MPAQATTERTMTSIEAKETAFLVIAYVLLFLYVLTASYMIYEVARCGLDTTCATITLPQGQLQIVTTVGGLVSALVIARLTLSTPTGSLSLTRSGTDGESPLVTGLAWTYVALWMLVGLAALIVGVVLYPGVNQSVTDLGTAWLGIALASGYAYFRIDPR
jgi:hypothetical protein